MPGARLLVVDDELSMREFLHILLTKEGYHVDTAVNGQEAIRLLESHRYDLVVTDIKMPGLGGVDVLRAARKKDTEMAVVMITAYASPESVKEAVDLGATDYVTKPFRVDDLKHVIASSLEKSTLVRENIHLKAELGNRYGYSNIFGAHPSMREIYDLIKRVSATRSNVLILGETGTGKELVAKAIHFNSPRSSNPFVVVNCGAIPDSLWESELFGHRKGAFTGAVSEKRGLFQVAHQGTLFLDEVGEIPLNIQVKLLRVIQERKLLPIGATQDEIVDVRIIAATNRDLEREVGEGRFREDLYYRLNVIAINIPPLRERTSDIPMLVNFFMEKFATEIAKDVRKISSEAMDILKNYNFPGNVRELENIIERAVTLDTSGVILPESLPKRIRAQTDASMESEEGTPRVTAQGINLEDEVARFERRLLTEALELSDGVKTEAARLLGITFRSFRYRLRKYGLETDSGDGDDLNVDDPSSID